MAARTANAPGAPTTKLGKAAYELDDRMIVAPWLRRTLNKVYPDHWSFLLGEIALYSFLILLLSGTYLTFFFDASMREVVYGGSYAPLRGVEMSAAYDSALRLSFDVRGGLFMRQLHHWAALLFVASILVHMLRIFFTGAFRRPRETNWLLGVVMFVLALLMGVTGYSLPDDQVGQGGLRTRRSDAALSVAPPDDEQGLPRPLVVPARRDRALLVPHSAAVRHVPDVLLRRLDA